MNYQTYFPNTNSGGQPCGPEVSRMQPAQIPVTNQPQTIPSMQQGTQMPVQPSPQQGFSPASRIVTSRDEAAVVTADFSGALMVFPDIAHNRVYIKQWNLNTGSADFSEYIPTHAIAVQQEPYQPQSTAFASLQDFQNLQDMVETLRKEIDRLKKPVGKAVRRNDANDE